MSPQIRRQRHATISAAFILYFNITATMFTCKICHLELLTILKRRPFSNLLWKQIDQNNQCWYHIKINPHQCA